MALSIDQLQQLRGPVQERVGELPAVLLGWGADAGENLQLRKGLGRPGAPFGGLGFFDPRGARETAPSVANGGPQPELTADVVRDYKLREFQHCAEGTSSMYFWALQLIFDIKDRATSAEVLLRARNGSDCAPFEDIQALMDPAAPAEVKQLYAQWKAAEIVDFTLKALREHPELRRLRYIATNLRPLDASPSSSVYLAVAKKLEALSTEDRQLLVGSVVLEITEDQEYPDDIERSITAWRQLGFSFAFDDTLGDLACEALGMAGLNFNTTSRLEGLLENFCIVKADMEWVGHMIFLTHPCTAARPALREEIQRHARDEDLVYVPHGPTLRSTGVKHSAAIREFAQWAQDIIAAGKRIVVELTVRPEEGSHAFCLEMLRDAGLDIFGEHQAHFSFQGGPCGAKAFIPQQLAGAVLPEQATRTVHR